MRQIKIEISKKEPTDKGIVTVCFTAGDRAVFRAGKNGREELCLGVGESKKLGRHAWAVLVRRVVAAAKTHKAKDIAISLLALAALGPDSDLHDVAERIAVNAELANFDFVGYKTPPKQGWSFVARLRLFGDASAAVREGVNRGQIIGREVNACRALSNTPGGEMTPRKLAAAAKLAARGTSVKVSALDEAGMKKLKMGGILGVAQGSVEPPRFIRMDYRGAPGKPIVFVGKGITFDTGGLNIKTGDYMYEMHMDMSGGAAAIHAIVAAAKLGIKKHVIAIVPAAENMPSGVSYRPGDILRSMSGKTIEVINTDAEGRIVLADALTYAERLKPELVVDVATLTGAAMVALGQRASAVFSKDEALLREFFGYGEATSDFVWPLPLWDEYEEEVRGTFGDVANASKSRYGGAINGAMFLYQFAKNIPWVHIDIAPRMTAVESEYLAKGAVGAGMQLLVKLVEERAKRR